MSAIAAIAAGFSAAGTPTSAYNGLVVTGMPGSGALFNAGYNGGGGSGGDVQPQPPVGDPTLYRRWYTANVQRLGTAYWAKVTVVSGSVTQPPAYQLGTVINFYDSTQYGVQIVTATLPTVVRVQIYSDAGGANQVADGTVTFQT